MPTLTAGLSHVICGAGDCTGFIAIREIAMRSGDGLCGFAAIVPKSSPSNPGDHQERNYSRSGYRRRCTSESPCPGFRTSCQTKGTLPCGTRLMCASANRSRACTWSAIGKRPRAYCGYLLTRRRKLWQMFISKLVVWPVLGAPALNFTWSGTIRINCSEPFETRAKQLAGRGPWAILRRLLVFDTSKTNPILAIGDLHK